ncbi:response regulator [Taibaiella koreensis]|uniref:response regulator n=1 Tax=Taibaiella koreensis TaxID=1268548 RepID=UPI000E5A0F01|nr:response regulator [Taibaiella koreensis]
MENRKRVLIVENEVILSSDMTITLTHNGYECRAVSTGEEAIALLSQFNPDIILMDIGLDGKIDGISTAGIIRRQLAQPIIFITEQDADPIFQQAKLTQPNNYLTKPYTDAALLRAVQMAEAAPPTSPGAHVPAEIGDRVTDGIFVFAGDGYSKVIFSDILCLETLGMSTIMYCEHGKNYKVSISSNNLAIELDYPPLIRVSRFHYVNIHKVDQIKKDLLIVGTKEIPWSKKYREDILSRLKKIAQNK